MPFCHRYASKQLKKQQLLLCCQKDIYFSLNEFIFRKLVKNHDFLKKQRLLVTQPETLATTKQNIMAILKIFPLMRKVNLQGISLKISDLQHVSARSRTSTDSSTYVDRCESFQTSNTNRENTGTESRRELDTAQPVNLPSALLRYHIFLKDFPQKAETRLSNARTVPTAKSERTQAM